MESVFSWTASFTDGFRFFPFFPRGGSLLPAAEAVPAGPAQTDFHILHSPVFLRKLGEDMFLSHGQIQDPSAAPAVKMIVPPDVRIKMHRVIAFQTLHYPGRGKIV